MLDRAGERERGDYRRAPLEERQSWIAGVARELAAALRSAWHGPRHALPVLISVALGVGASLAVFAVFSALMLRPLPFAQEERLVRVGYRGVGQFWDPADLLLSQPLLERFRGYSDVFESLAGERRFAVRLELPGALPRWVSAQMVDAEFFETLGVQARRGRVFSARDASGVVVREGCWRGELGMPALGTVLKRDGVAAPLVGVISDEQALPNYGCVWFVPPASDRPLASSFYYYAYARLAPGVTPSMAEQRLRGLTAELQIENPRGERMLAGLMPLRQILVDAERSWLSLMVAAVLVFLAMACANLAALLATRAAAHQHDRAVCAALGATRWALVRQAVLEGLVLVALGALGGLALAELGIAWANESYADVLGNLPARIDVWVLAGLLLLIVCCTLAASLGPLWVLRHVAPIDALRADARSSASRGAGRIRRAMMVVQVAAMVALSIDAGLLARSLLVLLGRDTGFSSAGVVTAKLILDAPGSMESEALFFAQRDAVQRQTRAALERLRRLEGVRRAGLGRAPLDYASERLQMELEPGARYDDVSVRIQNVDSGYFETLGIERLSGQMFGPEHEGWPPQRFAIVSRNFAEQALGVHDAVGHRLRFQGPPGSDQQRQWIEIIGMVEDTLEEPLTDPAPMLVYFPFMAYPNRAVHSGNVVLRLVLESDQPELVISRLPAALAEVLPRAPVTEVQLLSELVNQSIGRRRALSEVLSALALVAVLLATIGLAAATSYSVAQRSRELAIRRALGASERRIRRDVFAETGALVGLGVLFGVTGAALSRRLLASNMYGIEPFDPLTYAAALATTALIVVLAAWVATRPILRSSPARVLARS